MVEGDEVFFFFFFLWASEAYAVDDGSKSLRVCCFPWSAVLYCRAFPSTSKSFPCVASLAYIHTKARQAVVPDSTTERTTDAAIQCCSKSKA